MSRQLSPDDLIITHMRQLLKQKSDKKFLIKAENANTIAGL